VVFLDRALLSISRTWFAVLFARTCLEEHVARRAPNHICFDW